ncbi:MAG: FAD-binding protein [Desulfomonilaceae bacterium]|nr:FAD-binding protein [Desulfomonilaceae bacterium]
MPLARDMIDEIRRIVQGRVDANVPLSRLTSFRIGGPADVVAEPADSQNLARLLHFLHDRNVPRILLGAGTNVLFHDAGFRGVVIRTTAMRGFEIQTNHRMGVYTTNHGIRGPVSGPPGLRLGDVGEEGTIPHDLGRKLNLSPKPHHAKHEETPVRSKDVLRNGSEYALITVAAGTPLPSVIRRACDSGWTGLEPLWGIPGSFGGAVVTNAGAGGRCTGDFLERVRLLTISGEEMLVKKPDIMYAYRSMDLPGGTAVVEGTLRLPRGRTEHIEAELQRARTRRRASQPCDGFSAGCIFKNPSPERPAGLLIDRLGFKGATVGGAEVSRIHANFIINRGHATSSDVVELVEKIKESVRDREKIDLELEIQIVGEEACHV